MLTIPLYYNACRHSCTDLFSFHPLPHMETTVGGFLPSVSAYVCFDSMIKFIIFITVCARFTFPDNTQVICILESRGYWDISVYTLLLYKKYYVLNKCMMHVTTDTKNPYHSQRPLNRKILNITLLLVNLFAVMAVLCYDLIYTKHPPSIP